MYLMLSVVVGGVKKVSGLLLLLFVVVVCLAKHWCTFVCVLCVNVCM